MKTVGIIGGVGPETTSKFYLDIIFSCQKKDKTNRPPILIYSVSVPYEVEKAAILKGEGEEKYTSLLVDAARRLEKAGADFLIMPCNSLHEFIAEIRNSVKIPVLSIIEETTNFLEDRGITKVGIISSPITIGKKLYETPFLNKGITQIKPNDFQQTKINKIIYNLVSGVKNDEDKKELIRVIEDFKEKDVRHIILACTDLQLLISEYPGLYIYDTMSILSGAAVREVLT